MKIRFPFAVPALIAVSVLTGCAQINAGLEELNGALGKANAALSGSGLSNVTGQSYTIPDKVTAQYEIRNLKLTLNKVSDSRTDVKFDGQAFNKTNKLLNVAIVVPVYDKQNYYVTSVRAEVNLPPGEKSRVDKIAPFALEDGHHLNTQKTKFTVATY
ncbi:MAG: hypothetical protein Q4C79_04420 [Neisseria sp.]|uniref:hypothetical protein n=1 Tax=Neisseria sp. TaxID=192066 RepID=UPI0026DCEC58|nr:hypothetical protein [Neisseria sp.]MDO4248198.1 hypothetical protein [Neisseria sp.]